MAKEKKDKSNPEKLKREQELWKSGILHIAGTDEVGRGPFAGPVVACAVIMPKNFIIPRLTDSKKLNKNEHGSFAEEVKKQAISWAIGLASVEEIDELNIKNASRLAMKRAVEGLQVQPDYLLVDGTEVVDVKTSQEFIIKGDFNSHTISAAAIVAKVHRDKLMKELDETYGNVYGWANNAGYQTEGHINACRLHGVTPHHRKSWATMLMFKKEE